MSQLRFYHEIEMFAAKRTWFLLGAAAGAVGTFLLLLGVGIYFDL